jgi:adenylate cyclase
VQLDPNLPQAHAQLGWVLLFKREHGAGIAEFERAFALNHNFVESRFALGLILCGGASESNRNAPGEYLPRSFSPFRQFWFSGSCLLHGQTLRGSRADAASIPIAQAKYANSPALVGCCIRPTGAACRGEVRGGGCLRIEPGFTIDRWKCTAVYKDPNDAEHLLGGLRKAGLPES